MIAPSWLRTDDPADRDRRDDRVPAAAPPTVPESEGREVQIGGPDVLSYAEMLDRMAMAMGKPPRRKLPVPLHHARGSRRSGSAW